MNMGTRKQRGKKGGTKQLGGYLGETDINKCGDKEIGTKERGVLRSWGRGA